MNSNHNEELLEQVANLLRKRAAPGIPHPLYATARSVLDLVATHQTVEVVRGFIFHDDGSQSPVERWVRASDDRWVSLDSERQTRRDLTWVLDGDEDAALEGEQA